MDIRTEIANALHWSIAIPRDRVSAEVDEGIVTLSGVVDRTYQKSCAEAVIRCVPGVVAVRNNIAVRSAAEFSWPTTQR